MKYFYLLLPFTFGEFCEDCDYDYNPDYEDPIIANVPTHLQEVTKRHGRKNEDLHPIQKSKLELLVPIRVTVQAIKEILKEKFDLRLDKDGRIPLKGCLNNHPKQDILFDGCNLKDKWTLSSLGIGSGEVLRAFDREERRVVLYVYSAFNEQVYQLFDELDFQVSTVVSRETGLPVSIFRLVTGSGIELFDNFPFTRYYELQRGCTLRLDIWDGWKNLLNYALNGQVKRFLFSLSKIEKLAKYQAKVGLYIAAHLGLSDMAEQLTSKKSSTAVNPGESIGLHPAREWCKNPSDHIECGKASIHVAAQRGNLHIIKIFVANNISCLFAPDWSDAKAWNYALRYKQKPCARYLLAKCFGKVPYGKGVSANQISISVAVKMRLWLQRSRERVYVNKRFASNTIISKSLSQLQMSGSAVAIDGPRYMNNMRSDAKDRMMYLSVDELQRKRYWKTGNEKEVARFQKVVRRYSVFHSSSKIIETGAARFREKKSPKTAPRLKKTISVQNVFLTQLANQESEEPLIPDSLPMATAAERDEKIPLPASFSTSEPAFMLERSFKKNCRENNLLPRDSNFDAANLLSMSVAFKKKPFLRQVDIARRMAREYRLEGRLQSTMSARTQSKLHRLLV
ncbi:Oidioi.mRNA.OKI2018_I69.XSR.g14492.t1.cds [Oikopleura dioica]|uniref:Oidioi.mRNA.OKI2018_I69.XSR.g14492.t1.cds n=1 Tax=Oikopleura dioica TaxID=34765 RepID=A0ABN7SAH2_OIKDI|nr:Oidioi.mRNA.OKI2018_I69.XSR.g14492.t1.cds [Oikopleura dioica]